MRIKPFRAIRPTPEQAAQVASPPYDVMNSEEARKRAAGNPLSFLHVVKPEIDLPEGTNLYSDDVYRKAVDNFAFLRERGALIQESAPCLYLYAQKMGEHTQYGLVTCCHVDDYRNNIIKKHEHTRKKKEDDRTRHVSELNANAGPVFLTYRDDAQINECLDAVKNTTPLYHFTADDDVEHTVWKMDQTDPIMQLFDHIPEAYVADGHHRSASAVRVGLERRAADPTHSTEAEYNWYLVVLFPASQLKILPYNRCVSNLNGHSKEAFLTQVGETFAIQKNSDSRPSHVCQISMYLDGEWYGLSWDALKSSDPVASMDVSILQERLLSPILGIGDPREDTRIDFVGGIRGPEELKKRVDSGRDAVAFSMFPTSVDQLMAVADADKVMPPKSTWFEPKLRSGLLVHLLD